LCEVSYLKDYIKDNKIQLSFKDNGIGINPEYQEQIFDIFKQLHNNHSGTGIGLTLCKKIVSIHNGKIWLDSTLGEGTTFYIELPLTRV